MDESPNEIKDEVKSLDSSQKKSLDKTLYSWKKTALTEEDLQKFCRKNKLQFAVNDLSNLGTPNEKDNSKGFFLFTGEKADEFNNGSPKHWLYVWLNAIFDSYGKHDYKTDDFEYFKNHPRQYQEYETDVCGQYCLAFAWFIQHNPNLEPEDGIQFAEEFGLTKNRRQNDEIVKEWYEENK
jgi:hypothetical protein